MRRQISTTSCFLIALGMVACGGSEGGVRGNRGTGPDTADSAAASASSAPQVSLDEVARLEAQGVLPLLDRSSDIGGPDANRNGVRDDIEAQIDRMTLTDAQKKAALQRARNQQDKLLVDVTDKAAVQSLSEHSMAATKCIGDAFEPERKRSYELSRKIEAMTANTPERAAQYMRYMAALSGTSVAYPDGNTCVE